MASFDPHISIFKDLFPKKIEDLWFLLVFSGNWGELQWHFWQSFED